MRIGIESHFAEEEGTGNCTYTQSLIKNLAILDNKNDYILYCTDKDLPFYKEIRRINKNFRMVELKVKNKFLRIPFYLGIKASKDKVGVIHTQYYCLLIGNAKKLVTVHDVSPIICPQFFSWFEVLKQKVFLPFFVKRADRIIADSDSSREDIIRYLKVGKNRVVKIYNGVSSKFKIIDRNENIKVLDKFGIKGPYVYYIGRLDTRKNIENIIRAFSGLSREYRNVVLVIAGKKNKYFVRLSDLVRLCNLEGKVKFIGFISEEDNVKLLNFAEFFIYPSFYEGFGLPILEAMSCGCPVVTSNVSSLLEIVGDAGIYWSIL